MELYFDSIFDAYNLKLGRENWRCDPKYEVYSFWFEFDRKWH